MAMLDGMQPCVNMDVSAGMLVPDFSHPQPRTFPPVDRAESAASLANFFGVPSSDVEFLLGGARNNYLWEEVRLDTPCPISWMMMPESKSRQ